MVVLRRIHRRATSVPVDDDEPARYVDDSALDLHRTRLISNAVLDNTDALSAASKRNDAQLMRDINARIVTEIANSAAPVSQPVMTRRRSFTPAYIPNKPPVQPPTNVTYKLTSTTTDNSDIDRSVDLLMPVTARTLRAGSVPPALGSAMPILSPEEMDLVKARLVNNGPMVIALNGPKVVDGVTYIEEPVGVQTTRYVIEREGIPESFYYYPQSVAHLTPTDDLAVRQAHRNLDRIEHELKTDVTLAPPPAPLPPIRTYATVDVGPRRRSSSYHGPLTGIRGRSPSPLRDVYTVPLGLPSYYRYLPSYSTLPTYRATVDHIPPLPPSAKSVVTRSSYMIPPLSSTVGGAKSGQPIREIFRSVSFTGGSTRPVSTVIESSRPYSGRPLSADLEALVQSARTLPEVPLKTYHGSSVGGSYVPKSLGTTPLPSSLTGVSTTGLPPVVKPRVSETRRRVRDVLCRTKGDPHYFD